MVEITRRERPTRPPRPLPFALAVGRAIGSPTVYRPVGTGKAFDASRPTLVDQRRPCPPFGDRTWVAARLRGQGARRPDRIAARLLEEKARATAATGRRPSHTTQIIGPLASGSDRAPAFRRLRSRDGRRAGQCSARQAPVITASRPRPAVRHIRRT